MLFQNFKRQKCQRRLIVMWSICEVNKSNLNIMIRSKIVDVINTAHQHQCFQFERIYCKYLDHDLDLQQEVSRD